MGQNQIGTQLVVGIVYKYGYSHLVFITLVCKDDSIGRLFFLIIDGTLFITFLQYCVHIGAMGAASFAKGIKLQTNSVSSVRAMITFKPSYCLAIFYMFITICMNNDINILRRLKPKTRRIQRINITRFKPRTTILNFRISGFIPRSMGLKPRTSGFIPKSMGLKPRTSGFKPRGVAEMS